MPRLPHHRALLGRACLLAAVLLGGCNTLKLNSTTGPQGEATARDKGDRPIAATAQTVSLPSKNSVRVSQFVFFADFKLDADDPLFRELGDLREQVYRELQLPPANTLIQVYLFEERDRYDRFMKAGYPDLPRRRAFFVAQPRAVGGTDELLVYTFRGDRIRQDLRHELTHAMLHSVLKDVPLWLDEGLAEFFELPPGSDGLNPQHLEQLRKTQFAPNLARLERMHQVVDMSPAEYREAWAWVHLMLRGSADGKSALLAYLQQLRTTATPGPLQPRLTAAVPGLTDALESHLSQMAQMHALAQSR
ncbi:MAG TPA: hypothetical protein VH120_03875 [Gemmataceae bacterium]|jgi:hypothetical protein|nr:hypothetical protein [Gemmataceae bacterium]